MLSTNNNFVKIFAIILIVKVLNYCSCDDVFLIAKKYDGKKYFCLTNSSFGLSWLSNDNDATSTMDSTKTVSSFFSNSKNTFSNFDEEFKIQSWASQSMISEQIILDRRWEQFEIHRTEHNNTDQAPLQFEIMAENLKPNSLVSFSIRIKKDAHIFLCDGKNVTESNCYWLLLMGFGGTKTLVRKCPSGNIPYLNNVPRGDKCNETRIKSTTNFLSSTMWKHFRLGRVKDSIILRNSDDEAILTYPDNSFNVNYMIIHSKHGVGLWKLHKINYYRTKEHKTTTFENFITAKNNAVCITAFLKMCLACEIQFKFMGAAENNTFIQTYTTTGSKWMEIQFNSNNQNAAKLVITTIKLDIENNAFWEISDLRQCSNEGFRIIKSNGNGSCQLMSSKPTVLTLRKNLPTKQFHGNHLWSTTNYCPEDTVSRYCVPCSVFLNTKHCGKLKICKKISNVEQCSCAAGYQTKGSDDCNDECTNGRYGHNCQKQCSQLCKNNHCNTTTGECISCKDGHFGFNCAEAEPFTKNPPKVVSTSYTEAVFNVPSNNMLQQEAHILTKFWIEYKIAKTSDNKWISANKTFYIGKEDNITISNLQPGTKYVFRVFHEKDTKYYYYGSFSTRCDDVTAEDLVLKPKNTSINFFVEKRENRQFCRFDNTEIRVDVHPKEADYFYDLHNYDFTVNSLKPFRSYKVYLFDKIKNKTILIITAKTTEGIPDRNEALKTTCNSTKKICLKWESGETRGTLEYYFVEYEIESHLGCPPNAVNKWNWYNTTTLKNNVTLTNLTPYTKYTISVATQNNMYQGPFQTIQADTLQAKEISKNEIPKFQKTVQARSVYFKFFVDDCKILRGPLEIKLSTSCSTPWCKNDTKSYTIKNVDQLKDSNLSVSPFTNYSLKYEVCRKSCITFNYVFMTESEAPGTVKNLSVYRKNESSISIRWLPPHPPSGVIELYKIIVVGPNGASVEHNVTNSQCQLWSDFHCYTIDKLEGNQQYSVNIEAKNQLPNTFGQNVGWPSIITKKEPSKPPHDLKIYWTLDNDLKLQWKHPVEANGDIEHFKIIAFPLPENDHNQSTPIYQILSVSSPNNYKPIYTDTIAAKNFLSSKNYKIKVSAYNGFNGSEIFTEDSSPPEIPSFTSEPEIVLLNDTIRIETSRAKDIPDSHHHKLFLFVADERLNGSSNEPQLQRFKQTFKINLDELKLLYKCDRYKNSTKFTIGKSNHSTPTCEKQGIVTVAPGKKYNITILLVHEDGKKSSYKLYTDVKFSAALPAASTNLLPLLSLLLVIPIGIFIFIKRHEIIEKFTSIPSDDIPNEEVGLLPTPPKTEQIHSKMVKTSELETYVKDSLKSHELERQHALFPRGLIHPCKCGSIKENRSKNRYTNLAAYDHTRVVLAKIKDHPYSDYINANFIDGYKVPKAYIATQGPKMSTTSDFWRMIWQENVRHIAMLANIFEGKKRKVEKYWPEQNESLCFDAITVYYTSRKVFADYEHRIFRSVCNDEAREIHQYHFISWPDHGVPLYSQSLVPFLEKIQSIPLSSKSPVLVHCSAGVGRTGTILLCDIALRMAAETKSLDMLRILQQLRDQRPNMVDNVLQYMLAHMVILEYLHGVKTEIPCSDINTEVKKLIGNKGVEKQIRDLQDKEWQDDAMKSLMTKDETFVVVEEKNRFQTIVPDSFSNIYISRFPKDDPSSTYINAVIVDGFQCPGRFIVTQQPMPNTVGDFWRLVEEKNISVIISLNNINLKNDTSCRFWPANANEEFKPVEFMTLKNANTLSLNFYDSISLQLHIADKEDYKSVEIMAFKEWKSGNNCPKNLETFFTFCEESQAVARQSKPVLITCFDGALASGLYVSLTFIIEKMKLEQVCDVCQAVRAVRQNRKEFVQNKEQFEFLYKAAVAYIDSFQFYANFN